MAKLNAIFAHGLNGEFSLADGSLPWKGKPELNECARKDMSNLKLLGLMLGLPLGFLLSTYVIAPLYDRVDSDDAMKGFLANLFLLLQNIQCFH